MKKNYYILLAALVLIVLGGWYVLKFKQPWRAVFLANNQVYFGKFYNLPFSSSVGLTKVYYLRVAEQIQPVGNAPQPTINLVKLGSELHGPVDKMVIPKAQILFWEDLRSDSSVVRAIESSIDK